MLEIYEHDFIDALCACDGGGASAATVAPARMTLDQQRGCRRSSSSHVSDSPNIVTDIAPV